MISTDLFFHWKEYRYYIGDFWVDEFLYRNESFCCEPLHLRKFQVEVLKIKNISLNFLRILIFYLIFGWFLKSIFSTPPNQ